MINLLALHQKAVRYERKAIEYKRAKRAPLPLKLAPHFLIGAAFLFKLARFGRAAISFYCG
jgi:hypothetical protein